MDIATTTEPAKISAARVYAAVCIYVEAVTALHPQSSAAALLNEGGRAPINDDRLVKLLQIMDHANPFQHCSPLEAKVLVLQAMGRKHQDVTEERAGGSVVIGGRGRMMTNEEIGEFVGKSKWRVKELLASARDKVRLVYGQRRARRSPCAA